MEEQRRKRVRKDSFRTQYDSIHPHPNRKPKSSWSSSRTGTLLSVSDHQDVIQITGRASTFDVALRRVHTSDEVLHGRFIDTDRDQSDLRQSSLDRRLSLLRLRHLSPSLDVRKSFLVLADLQLPVDPPPLVRIVFLRGNSMRLDVVKGILWSPPLQPSFSPLSQETSSCSERDTSLRF